MLVSLLLTLATIVVTAIGFQHAVGVSGLWTIPAVILIGFLPFGRLLKFCMLLVGGWYIYAYGVDGDTLEKMFRF